MQYIALIHNNTESTASPEEWNQFFRIAGETSMFKGGSAIGARHLIGAEVPDTTKIVGGFMRFDSDDLDQIVELLNRHPVIKHGGTIELCDPGDT